MVLLNILQNTDGTLAWDNLLILVLAVMAGYFLHRFGVKKIENKNLCLFGIRLVILKKLCA